MNIYDGLVEDEDMLFEDDDFFEDDDSYDDDLSERRRPKRARRRAPNIRAGKTASGRGLFKPKVAAKPVTSANLQASLERVGKDIRTNAAAIKRLEAQAKAATARLTSVNNAQDGAIKDLRTDLKKQSDGAQQQNQLNMLLPLLQKSPELEIKPGATADDAAAVLNAVQLKKQDNTMALVLMMMAANTSGGSQNSMNMMLPMVLLMER